MRILHLNNYADDAFGGGETHLLRLLDGLGDQYEFSAGLTPNSAIAHAVLEQGVPVLPVRWRGVPWRAVSDIATAARRAKADLIHAHGYYPGILARLAAGRVNAAVAVTQHCSPDVILERGDTLGRRLVVWLRGRVDNATARRVCRLIAVSDMVAERMRVQGFPPEKIKVVHNGVPVDAVIAASRGEAARQWVARPPGRFVVGTAARLEPSKNTSALVEAARLLPAGIEVRIAGDGPQRAELERLAVRAGVGDAVTFVGHQDNVPAFLAGLDVLVVPVPRGGLNVVMLEAMAVGTPVVGVTGGAVEAVEDGATGLLVPQARPELLANAVRRLLDDPALRQSIVTAARERVRAEFSIEAMLRGIASVYDECAPPSRSVSGASESL